MDTPGLRCRYTPRQIAYGTGDPSAVENLDMPELLRAAFADMRIAQLEAYDAEIHEGVGHTGMSALIDLVAYNTQQATATD